MKGYHNYLIHVYSIRVRYTISHLHEVDWDGMFVIRGCILTPLTEYRICGSAVSLSREFDQISSDTYWKICMYVLAREG